MFVPLLLSNNLFQVSQSNETRRNTRSGNHDPCRRLKVCGYIVWFCVSDQESTSLVWIISVFIMSHLSNLFSLLSLSPTIFDHCGMKNVTGHLTYTNFSRFSVEESFWHSLSVYAVSLSSTMLQFLQWFMLSCMPTKKKKCIITVRTDVMFLFLLFNTDASSIKPQLLYKFCYGSAHLDQGTWLVMLKH